MGSLIRTSDIARLAGLRSPAAVSNWRRRPGHDFPRPVAGTSSRPLFDAEEVVAWLKAHNPARYSQLDVRGSDQWLLSAFDELALILGAEGATALCLSTLAAMRLASLIDRPMAVSSGGSALTDLAAQLDECVDLGAPAQLSTLLLPLLEGPQAVWTDLDRTIRALVDNAARATSADLAALGDLIVSRGVREYAKAGGKGGSVDAPMSHLLASLACGRTLPNAPKNSRFSEAIPEILSELELDRSTPRTALDTACGIGEALVRIGRATPGALLLGHDADTAQAARLSARLFLEGREGEVRTGRIENAAGSADPLEAGFVGVDRLVCEPPFGGPATTSPSDPRWRFGLPRGAAAEFAWIEDAVSRLAPDGRAFVIASPASASGSAQPQVEIRRRLLLAGCVHGLVALPAGLSPATPAASMLWVLRPAGGSREVVLVDASRRDESRAPRVTAARIPGARLLEDPIVDLSPTARVGDDALGPDEILRLRSEAEERAGEIAEELSRALASLGDEAPPRATHTLSIRELHAARALKLVRDVQAGRDESETRIIGIPELRRASMTHGVLSDVEPPAKARTSGDSGVTRPGDLLIVLAQPIRVVLDREGGHRAGRGVRVLRCDPRILDPTYLAHALRGPWNERILRARAGRRDALLDLEIPMMPLEEQREWAARTASALALVDRAKNALEAVEEFAELTIRGLHPGA